MYDNISNFDFILLAFSLFCLSDNTKKGCSTYVIWYILYAFIYSGMHCYLSMYDYDKCMRFRAEKMSLSLCVYITISAIYHGKHLLLTISVWLHLIFLNCEYSYVDWKEAFSFYAYFAFCTFLFYIFCFCGELFLKCS